MRWRIRTGDGRGLAGAALSTLALLLATPACARPAEGHGLELLAFSQRDVRSVALNEELLFYFSADLDRTSITTGSVRVIDERGGEVPGARVVRGNALSFLPELPRSRDLSDGGLQPGVLYRVVLGGFPRPDGIRSRSGALLSAAMTLSFRTAEKGSPLFVDPFFEPSPLVARGEHRAQEVVVAEGRIELECGEALDPMTVDAQGFALLRFPEGGGAEELDLIPVPIRVRLVENRREQALLVIEPADQPAFEHGEYYLSLTEHGPRTFGRRRVEAGWPGVLKVRVRAPRIELDLKVPQSGSTEPPPGCDGTAWWGEQGLTIRYPAAAGTGADGNVELPGPEGNDIHATRLSVPSGTSIALGDRQGPLVLRSQGTLEIAGKLSRTGFKFHPGPLSKELQASLSRGQSEWERLGPWVARLLTPDAPWSREPWTVLIAGGDLVVPRDGKIEVDGPLLLAAGGWIRVEGSVVAREVWRTPEGGGNIAGRVGLEGIAGRGGLQLLPLVLEPPTVNPLRQTLRVGVLTRLFPLPQLSGSIWLAKLDGEEKGGQEDVEFLEQRRDGSLASVGRAIDPARQSSPEYRALIQLSMPAGDGEPWDPPRLLRFTLKPLPPAEESPRRP